MACMCAHTYVKHPSALTFYTRKSQYIIKIAPYYTPLNY